MSEIFIKIDIKFILFSFLLRKSYSKITTYSQTNEYVVSKKKKKRICLIIPLQHIYFQ